MNATTKLLNASEAAAQLGVSAKALRLYEERGLIVPARTAAGWRAYDARQMKRAGEIVALRALGLSLSDVALVLAGDTRLMERVLAAHEEALQARVRDLAGAIDKVRGLRADIARGVNVSASDVAVVVQPVRGPNVSFDLPWPWDGEHFELSDIKTLNFIVGPLGSGKTRLAMKLAEAMPEGFFLGVDRLLDDGAAARAQRDADPDLCARIERSEAAIIEGGGSTSAALLTLLTGLEAVGNGPLIVDVPEQGLDAATQEALMSHLRRRAPDARPLFLLTRSNAILDLDFAREDETIIFCPANHNPPMLVRQQLGAPGYEGVATCLGTPEVRARTEGVIAWRPTTSLVASVAAARAGSLAP